jgi:hypothetical protein
MTPSLPTGFLTASRRTDAVRLVPWADSQGGGIAFAARF